MRDTKKHRSQQQKSTAVFFINSISTCIILLLLVIYWVTGKVILATKARNILWVCSAFSMGPLAFGINYFSIVGALITASLIAELILLSKYLKKEN